MSIVARPSLDGATREDRAAQLFELLASELVAGRPILCTYKAAVDVVLGCEKYTPAYGSMLLKLATRTGAIQVDSLGEIRLDTFLVVPISRDLGPKQCQVSGGLEPYKIPLQPCGISTR